MFILVIRTDKPEAEIGLYDGDKPLLYEKWEAHRALAETIHGKIRDLLEKANKKPAELEGVVAFKGPGSFTGLRIGLSVANATAYGLGVPVVSAQGEDWQTEGISRLEAGENEVTAMPEYGAEVHITKARK